MIPLSGFCWPTLPLASKSLSLSEPTFTPTLTLPLTPPKSARGAVMYPEKTGHEILLERESKHEKAALHV
jgi:hypothetical protein